MLNRTSFFDQMVPVNVDTAEPSTPGKVNPSMAENYYLFFKPLPAGHHIIEAELIRQPLQSNQPVEQHTISSDLVDSITYLH